MKIATVLKASLAAVVLASATTTPVAAHGNIRTIVTYYGDNSLPEDPPVGQYTIYCDNHLSYWGIGGTGIYTEEHFDCP